MKHIYPANGEEVLHISGCKVILRYAESPTPGAMSNLRAIPHRRKTSNIA